MAQSCKIIGLTGGSGVGKGVVCEFLARRGAVIINADAMAHKIILRGGPAYDEVVARFGHPVLDAADEIDRKKLGAIVFGDKAALGELSRIVHKYVRAQCEAVIAGLAGKTIVIDAPVLIEAGMKDMCNVVIGIFAEKHLRISRIMARDGISRADALRRINSQMPDDVLKSHVDIAIDNNGTIEELEGKLDEI